MPHTGSRYAYGYDGDAGGLVLKKLEARALVNLAARYRGFLVPGMTAAVTLHDAFNAGEEWAQPYNGGHPPLPGPSREWGFRLSYESRL